MSWREYALALLVFNLVGGALLVALELTQTWLPLNPQHLPNVPFALAFNTAVSFMTNTNWQAYSGEAIMSYFTQMAGLAVHNFVSAATGIAVAVALARGLVRKQTDRIGNFWTDLTRCTLYLLLPLSFVLALVLAQQGVVQTFDGYATATTLEGATQQIPLGPVASQIAIKQLGHKRRRIFRTKQRASFRESDAADEFCRSLRHLLDRLGAGLHVWRHGARSPPGLGDLGGDVRVLSGGLGARLVGGVATQSRRLA